MNKKHVSPTCFLFIYNILFEIAIQKAFECFSMASFITSDFMHSVMYCIQICFFCTFCKVYFTSCCTIFRINAQLQIFLCRRSIVLKMMFREFSCMFCFFPSCFFIIKTDFRIAFTMSNTSHCKIHADFRTFSFEICT